MYNHISSNNVPVKWGEIYDTAKTYLMRNPLEGMVWFPGGSFKQSLVINRWEQHKLKNCFFAPPCIVLELQEYDSEVFDNI